MYDLLNNDEQHSKKPQQQEGPVRTHAQTDRQTAQALTVAAALCSSVPDYSFSPKLCNVSHRDLDASCGYMYDARVVLLGQAGQD